MKKKLMDLVKILVALAFVAAVIALLMWKYMPGSPVAKWVDGPIQQAVDTYNEWRGVGAAGPAGGGETVAPTNVPAAKPPKGMAKKPSASNTTARVAKDAAAKAEVEKPKAKAADENALWPGLADENRYYGGKLKESDLLGKVVLVYDFSIDDDESVEMLPKIHRIWDGFHQHPFMAIGSHRGGRTDKVKKVVAEQGVGYPVYEGVAYRRAPRGRVPFIYVVDAKGKIVYQGRSDRDATQAVVEAITDAGVSGVSVPAGREVKTKLRDRKPSASDPFKNKGFKGLGGPKRL